ncbi:DUF2852 domain-containing protein [Pseudoxanthobacter sp.]|uniref:DUF2852 domain-containing protein n=1 Tax=Pseudoxanthobacter sp. TaxID=1925742 RepID=UPI002FE3A193
MTSTAFSRPVRGPLVYVATVAAFILWWPLGLLMVAYILWGDHFHRFADDLRGSFRRATACSPGAGAASGSSGFGRTGNAAFDDYRARELERLEAERRRLDEMRDEFDAFLQNLRRARDQEEFDRFMAGRNAGRPQG